MNKHENLYMYFNCSMSSFYRSTDFNCNFGATLMHQNPLFTQPFVIIATTPSPNQIIATLVFVLYCYGYLSFVLCICISCWSMSKDKN